MQVVLILHLNVQENPTTPHFREIYDNLFREVAAGFSSRVWGTLMDWGCRGTSQLPGTQRPNSGSANLEQRAYLEVFAQCDDDSQSSVMTRGHVHASPSWVRHKDGTWSVVTGFLINDDQNAGRKSIHRLSVRSH